MDDWKFWVVAISGIVAALYVAVGYHQDRPRDIRSLPTTRRPYEVMGLLLVLTWAGVGFDYVDRHFGSQASRLSFDAWDHYAFKQIRGETFKDMTLQIDGREYIDCYFENVSFFYQGNAPVRFTNCHYPKGTTFSFVSKNNAINQELINLSAFGAICGSRRDANEAKSRRVR
jgi:hypothetical protein